MLVNHPWNKWWEQRRKKIPRKALSYCASILCETYPKTKSSSIALSLLRGLLSSLGLPFGFATSGYVSGQGRDDVTPTYAFTAWALKVRHSMLDLQSTCAIYVIIQWEYLLCYKTISRYFFTIINLAIHWLNFVQFHCQNLSHRQPCRHHVAQQKSTEKSRELAHEFLAKQSLNSVRYSDILGYLG